MTQQKQSPALQFDVTDSKISIFIWHVMLSTLDLVFSHPMISIFLSPVSAKEFSKVLQNKNFLKISHFHAQKLYWRIFCHFLTFMHWDAECFVHKCLRCLEYYDENSEETINSLACMVHMVRIQGILLWTTKLVTCNIGSHIY